jgi:hypothetical protein
MKSLPRVFLLILPFLLLGLPANKAAVQQAADWQALAQFGTPTPTPATPSPTPTPAPKASISQPQAGQPVQGNVQISGSSAIDGFQSAELAFAYHDDPTGTWFLIAGSEVPVDGGVLGTWDTTTITDGDYDLRLAVRRSDGSGSQATVAGVRVRNYTPVETDTPTPQHPAAAGQATSAPQEAPASEPAPTATLAIAGEEQPPAATPLPPNPAQLSFVDVLLTLGKGVLAIMGVFVLIGVYGMIRRRK